MRAPAKPPQREGRGAGGRKERAPRETGEGRGGGKREREGGGEERTGGNAEQSGEEWGKRSDRKTMGAHTITPLADDDKDRMII